MRVALRVEIFARLRDRHQSAQRDPRQRRDFASERGCVGGCDAAFGGLAAHVDLQADIERPKVWRPLLGEALSNLETVDRMHPIEMLSDWARLVRLQAGD